MNDAKMNMASSQSSTRRFFLFLQTPPAPPAPPVPPPFPSFSLEFITTFTIYPHSFSTHTIRSLLYDIIMAPLPKFVFLCILIHVAAALPLNILQPRQFENVCSCFCTASLIMLTRIPYLRLSTLSLVKLPMSKSPIPKQLSQT